jgi:alcohol dehydrogenase class IV
MRGEARISHDELADASLGAAHSTGAAQGNLRFNYNARPAHVRFGAGRSAEAAEAARSIGITRALVLSTPEQRALAERIAQTLGELAAGIFSNAAMHTPVGVTEEALHAYRKTRADGVVSVGGGSTTGLGKAIALRTGAPQLAIPTTYAGSEMTPILGETEGGVKKTQTTEKVLPEAVIYDVELTLSLPPRLSATSGMNAIAHAVEALYARDGNPVVSLWAEEGIRALTASLPTIAHAPGSLPARSQAQYGAWLCAMCLGAVGMALHHKLCHVLGGAFELPHAETHAIVLPHAAAYNGPAVPAAMAKIASAVGAKQAPAGLYDLARSLKIPLALKELGMPKEGIDKAAGLALKNPYWNPRPLEGSAIRELIRRAWAGEPPCGACEPGVGDAQS